MELTLDTAVQYVPRVGPSMSKRLERLNISTVRDMLLYPPFRYNDYSLVSDISMVQMGETVTVKGTVRSHINLFTKNGKKIQKAVIADGTGTIDVIWFNQPFLVRSIRPGMTVYLAGRVDWFGRKPAMISPEYEIDYGGRSNPLHTGRLVPIYPETEGVSSKWLRGRISYLLEQGMHRQPEYMPEHILESFGLMPYGEALSKIHFPATIEETRDARRRLAFDELFLLQLSALEQRRIWEENAHAYKLEFSEADRDTFEKSLPFHLTGDQRQTVSEILKDMSRSIPMNRLLMGDVGSGKTVVAAFAIYAAYRNGKASVIMAPTQILAEQHYATLNALFKPLGIEVVLVTGKVKPKPAKTVGDPLVWVGTHALLSESITLPETALVVIDEQQRFGVNQRQLLREKGMPENIPHLLTMTATPIPRTIALTLFGNLDISAIMEMPSGRKPVKTWVVPSEKRGNAYEWIRKNIREKGSQAFIICPLIEPSESLGTVRTAKEEYKRLATEVFPDLHLSLIHGRMTAKEKTAALDEFKRGKSDILVATAVVEVGIDIPNATIIMIEASERFGLAQLHQLRGRVGRSDKESYCLLFTEATDDPHVLERLKGLEKLHNGPALSELDFRLRGPGEIFGTRQHGLPDLKFGSFLDMDLLRETNGAAHDIFQMDASLSAFPLLRQRLKEGTIGDKPQD